MSAAPPRPPSEGRVLVTGASRGIGRAVAEALLARGATVAASGRDTVALAALQASAPDRVFPLPADLSDPAAVDGLVDRAVEAAGPLDALVQCAGMVRYADVGGIARGDFEAQLALNLVAPVLLAQAFARHVREAGGVASIVHVASTLALRPAPSTLAYAASKAGLISATRTLAAELAPHGIRVNAVAPGVVDTDMIRVPRLRPGEPEPTGDARERRVAAELETLRSLHPLGRLGTPEEVAEAVLALLDAPWTTGAVHVVDGGLLAV